MTVEDPSSPPAGVPGAEDFPAAPRAAAGAPRQPWPPRSTFLWGILLLGGYFLIQAVVAMLALVPALVASDPVATRQPDGTLTTSRDLMAVLEQHVGLVFTVGTAVGAPLVVAATLALAWWGFARQGIAAPRPALGRSLGLVRPRFSQIALWTVVTAALLAGYEVLARLLDRPSLPDFMVDFHASAGWLPGLLFVVVFLAPLVEEVLFRGFLLPGLAAGRLGPAGAVAVTAVLFALVHTQYDPFDMSAVLALGLLLGAARWFSGSLWLAYGLHAAINAVAAAQLVWALGW